jgi:hypothetical protein
MATTETADSLQRARTKKSRSPVTSFKAKNEQPLHVNEGNEMYLKPPNYCDNVSNKEKENENEARYILHLLTWLLQVFALFQIKIPTLMLVHKHI